MSSAPTLRPTALIAEDEPLLAQALQDELAQVWPELQLVASVGDGLSAVQQALALQPDVLFFDIRMPGQSGLEAAAELADAWPAAPQARPFPLLVFVTAYDQYAIAAFEAQALDYLQKPVQRSRLQHSVERLQQQLRSRWQQQQQSAPAAQDAAMEAALAQLRGLLLQGAARPATTAPPERLSVLQVGVGQAIEFVPLQEVVYFEAADKYLRVLTAGREYLLRTSLRELLPQLDAAQFWQIHRGTVVQASQIASVRRDESGRTFLSLRQRAETLGVSRLYAARFRAM